VVCQKQTARQEQKVVKYVKEFLEQSYDVVRIGFNYNFVAVQAVTGCVAWSRNDNVRVGRVDRLAAKESYAKISSGFGPYVSDLHFGMAAYYRWCRETGRS